MFEMFDESRKIRLNSIPSWRLLYGAIFYWQCLVVAVRGRAGRLVVVVVVVVWLGAALPVWSPQLIQTRLDSAAVAQLGTAWHSLAQRSHHQAAK